METTAFGVGSHGHSTRWQAQPLTPWIAIATYPRHEKKVSEQLRLRDIESFLPTYTCLRRWRNRQTVSLTLPLFPGYMFARVPSEKRTLAFAPGVIQLLDGLHQGSAIEDEYVLHLQQASAKGLILPHLQPLEGDRVRIMAGPFLGQEGTLLRTQAKPRVVLSIVSIRSNFSVEVETAALQTMRPDSSRRSEA